jgi:hypothetical protein
VKNLKKALLSCLILASSVSVTYAEKSESEMLIERAMNKQKEMAREKAQHLGDLKRELLVVKDYLEKEQSDLTSGQIADVLLAATGAVVMKIVFRETFPTINLKGIGFGGLLFGAGAYNVYRASVKKEELDEYLKMIELTIVKSQDELSADDIDQLQTEVAKLKTYAEEEEGSGAYRITAAVTGSVLLIGKLLANRAASFTPQGVTNPMSGSLV